MKKYKDEFYETIVCLNNNKCLSYLIDWEEEEKRIKKHIVEYENFENRKEKRWII